MLKLLILSGSRMWVQTLRYLAGKALMIAIAIFTGVFFTVLIANQPTPYGLAPGRSPFEVALEEQIDLFIRISLTNGTIDRMADGTADPSQIEALTQQLRTDAGLELPFFARYLRWTANALTFNWGELTIKYVEPVGLGARQASGRQDLILEYLPNTLLLVGVAFLLVFLMGMPLALYLSRHQGGLLDHVLTVLSPLSSVPSWVFAILLIAIFAVNLKWLPVGGKFDFVTPENPFQYMLELSRHMVLPVMSIVLSVIFQVIYAWRTFFTIYSEEDYVDLARAKGLPARTLDRQYILRPALPYVMTSFTTIIIGFWQLTVALEAIFQWPGIGLLYIKEALPDYWGDAVDPGQLMLVIEIVVIFAYLLGVLVFSLDLAYVIVDPRIRLLPVQGSFQGQVKTRSNGLFSFLKNRSRGNIPKRRRQAGPPMSKRNSFGFFLESIQGFGGLGRLFLRELRHYPSAIFGLAIITIMLIGSIYAVVVLPYEKYGTEYATTRSTGRNYAPRVAKPAWTNLFRSIPQLSTIILDENSPQAQVVLKRQDDGWVQKTTTFVFEYDYQQNPSDMFLYLTPDYQDNPPFASLTWITPDGAEMELKSKAVSADLNYDFESGIHVAKVLRQHPDWDAWFVQSGEYPTPAFNLLFAAPRAGQALPQHGTYQLVVRSLLFEEGSDLRSELVLLGQVYGPAGTDYWRRDLTIPLLWGMPFALIIGLLGTFITLLVAMLLPAIGVWFGGWLDQVIQRLTEINMIMPGLTIAVLAYALFSINIWVVLGVVVTINAFGSPVKTFRSALLQAKEAPYIEAARAYGAGNFRIITRYLVPRILPILIPQLVTQIPGFIFLEATLGFFNIKSNYPSWGRVIYDGLSHGALYGSQFWVLLPISLLLLTGLAFAMLGTALERILNPRKLDQASLITEADSAKSVWALKTTFIPAGMMLLAGLVFYLIYVRIGEVSNTPSVSAAKLTIPTKIALPPASATATVSISATPVEIIPTPTQTFTATIEQTQTSIPASTQTLIPSSPEFYSLLAGEFPYCIARRYNVDPIELLTLNGFKPDQTFFTGMTLQIPQNGFPFPGNRVLIDHPASYVVSAINETIPFIACFFGDVDPVAIALVNQLPLDAVLFVGQSLNIP